MTAGGRSWLTRRSAARALVVAGFVQLAAAGVDAALDAAGAGSESGPRRAAAAVRGLAAATALSPAPKVFTVAGGIETFSGTHVVAWEENGVTRRTVITPALYARLAGPYWRRNVYGAALAYAPVLEASERTRAMGRSVAAFAIAGNAPLLAEMGIAPPPGAADVRVESEFRTTQADAPKRATTLRVQR